MNNKLIMSYKGASPKFDDTVYIAPSANVIGDVNLGEKSSVWFNTTIRGDFQPITIGKYTNVQDGSVIHVMCDVPTEIGNYVTIGHGATIHARKIGDNCLIGMGAILLGECTIGMNSVIAAGAIVTEGQLIPPYSMVMGVPAKIVREITEEEAQAIHEAAIRYQGYAEQYMSEEKETTK